MVAISAEPLPVAPRRCRIVPRLRFSLTEKGSVFGKKDSPQSTQRTPSLR